MNECGFEELLFVGYFFYIFYLFIYLQRYTTVPNRAIRINNYFIIWVSIFYLLYKGYTIWYYFIKIICLSFFSLDDIDIIDYVQQYKYRKNNGFSFSFRF